MDRGASPAPSATVSGWSVLAIVVGIAIVAVMALVILAWALVYLT